MLASWAIYCGGEGGLPTYVGVLSSASQANAVERLACSCRRDRLDAATARCLEAPCLREKAIRRISSCALSANLPSTLQS
jgi:hypothetical protein